MNSVREWYNKGRNVPVARTVAERPASVIWRSNAWRSASSKIGPQVTSCDAFLPDLANFPAVVNPAEVCYNNNTDCSIKLNSPAPDVRNSPPGSSTFLTDCRAAGLHLLVFFTPLQVSQLDHVVEDDQRISHDPQEIVYEAQKVVGSYHLLLLIRAYGLPAWRLYRRAGLMRYQALDIPHKPYSSFSALILRLILPCLAFAISGSRTIFHSKQRFRSRTAHSQNGTERGTIKAIGHITSRPDFNAVRSVPRGTIPQSYIISLPVAEYSFLRYNLAIDRLGLALRQSES